jgi:hypothetical protein
LSRSVDAINLAFGELTKHSVPFTLAKYELQSVGKPHTYSNLFTYVRVSKGLKIFQAFLSSKCSIATPVLENIFYIFLWLQISVKNPLLLNYFKAGILQYDIDLPYSSEFNKGLKALFISKVI